MLCRGASRFYGWPGSLSPLSTRSFLLLWPHHPRALSGSCNHQPFVRAIVGYLIPSHGRRLQPLRSLLSAIRFHQCNRFSLVNTSHLQPAYQAEPRRDDCKEAVGPLLLPPFTIWRACWLEYLVIIWHGRHLRAADIALSRVLCAPARSRRCLHSARHDSCLPSQRNAVIRASFWLLAHSVPLFTRSRTSRFSASPDMSRARCSVQQQEEMFGGNGMRGERVRQHQAHCSWYVLALGRAGQLSLRYGCVLIASFLSWW